jgi:CubicO group peptidase (beta-lactamase class C family)
MAATAILMKRPALVCHVCICVALMTSPARAQIQLEPAVKAASELPRLYSLLVSQRGTVILERYFNGRRATTPANMKSASKSVISALVGIAVERKLLSLTQPIGTWFPDLPDAKRAITIEDLLTMRSGLESTSKPQLRDVGSEPELGTSRAREVARGAPGH